MELLEPVHALENALGVRAQIRHVPGGPGDVPQMWSNVGKAERLRVYRPKTRPGNGLARTVDWYLSNRRWVEGVIAGEYLEYCRRVYG